MLGGVLYKKAGYAGVFGLGSGVLAIDFIMRLLVVEKKVAARYDTSAQDGAANPRQHQIREEDEETQEAGEEDALLPKKEEEAYIIPDGQNRVIRALPILYCMFDPRLLVAFLVGFVQASLLGAFDATIPTEADSLFGFDSLKSGLLFIALDIPYLLLGPVAGWTVDKYGTKPAAVIGFGYLVPTLILLRLPSDGIVHNQKDNIILYCAMLSLNGIGMATIGSPSIVEASDVVQKYDKANPKLFGENGPYAQLYGFTSIFFCLGLAIGPVLSGGLRDVMGYGNMNIALAAISLVTAVLSWVYIGGKPKILSRKAS